MATINIGHVVGTDFKYLDEILAYLRETKNLDSFFEVSKDYGRGLVPDFPLSEHVKGLVYSKLSQRTRWETVTPKLPQVDTLFFDWDVDKIREASPKYFFDGLTIIGVGSTFREDLSSNLKDNIDALESILSNNRPDSADFFTLCVSRLKGFGIALVAEYLSHIQVDRIKPDIHVKRFLKRFYNKIFSDGQAIEFGVWAKNHSPYNLSQIDSIIWSFCADGQAEICAATPKCQECVVKGSCAYPNINN